MKCNAKPYNEDKPYIFISYCHKDRAVVYPIIEQMCRDGYRIWYDEGIHPGSDWPEIIAARLNDCAVCICTISPYAVQSHSCRNELTFALENQKTTLTIMLEDFVMPLGMRLQLVNTQIIKAYEYHDNALFEKLYTCDALSQCLGEKQVIAVQTEDIPPPEPPKDTMHALRSRLESIHKADEPDEEERICLEQKRLAAAEAERIRLEEERLAAEEAERIRLEEKRLAAAEAERIRLEEERLAAAEAERIRLEEERLAAAETESADSMDEDEKCTVVETYGGNVTADEEENNTVLEGKIVAPVLLHFNSLRLYEGVYPMTSVGRSKKKNDIVLSEFATISSHHLDLIIYKKHNYVLDRGSANGTMLDGISLEENVRAEVTGCAELHLASEIFLAAFDQEAEFIRRNGTVAVLKAHETREKKYLFGDEIILGRSYKWEGGTMSHEKISRKHAVLSFENGNYYLKDISTNGTYLNNRRIPKDEPVLLSNGDDIRIGAEHLTFMQWTFGGEDHE